ncbi:PREDICTED: uncharacterized protein LOC109126330 [Camelina sativa]|uniref:Uncharacterized protein LOC109126330 n=1 Tax=Camelina sativa TaxID=90675 RepID=A0ABM1QF38_CAMSA|nr:PREDICTED: uncharacterized protein LOC109126330 [Camelina sativa]
MVLVLLSHPTLAVEEDNDEPPLMSNDEFDAALYATSPSKSKGKGKSKGKSLIYKTPNSAFLCFEKVVAEILVNKRASRDCCVGVVKAGKQYLMEFMKFIFQSYEFKRYNYKRFFKINKVWNRCSTEIDAPSSFSG